MKKIIVLFSILIIISFNSCWRFVYKIKIDDTENLKQTMSITEELIKKVEVLPAYEDEHYVEYSIRNDSISFFYSTLHYDPNDPTDSIRARRNGQVYSNAQKNIDTCKTVPGLTSEEWTLLKKNIYKLHDYGITANDRVSCGMVRLGIGGKNLCTCKYGDFWFFCYEYIVPKRDYYRNTGYLAVIPDSIVNTECFDTYFRIMDKKDGLYLIRRKV